MMMEQDRQGNPIKAVYELPKEEIKSGRSPVTLNDRCFHLFLVDLGERSTYYV